MNIAVLGKDFINWGGGRELLRFLIIALISKKDSFENIFLFIPQETRAQKNKRILKNNLKLILNYLKFTKYYYQSKPDNNLVWDDLKVVYYKDSDKNLISCLKDLNINVILPCLNPLGKSFPIPWIGYIADFQHSYYPEFFSKKECKYRDNFYKNILNNAKQIIVNGNEVRKDISKFYPQNNCSVFTLPFSPIPDEHWFDDDLENVKLKYNLPDKYFMICNQFWKHKSHITAFEALAKLEKRTGLNDIHIVCSGKTEDYRFPTYFQELKEKIEELEIDKRVHFLGYISKTDQINIMKNCIAVLQPTLFEGGPGGGAVYNAISIGIPSIVSDIPINLEIKNEENIVFFKAGNSDDMTSKIIEILNSNYKKTANNSLILKAQKRKEKLANKLLDVINYALEKENTNENIRNYSL